MVEQKEVYSHLYHRRPEEGALEQVLSSFLWSCRYAWLHKIKNVAEENETLLRIKKQQKKNNFKPGFQTREPRASCGARCSLGIFQIINI